MTYYIFLVLLIALSIVGVSELCKQIIYYMTASKSKHNTYLITAIEGHCEDAEQILRDVATRVKWMGKNAPKEVICLDCDMDHQTREICDAMCEYYGFMCVCTKSQLIKKIYEQNKTKVDK